MDTDPFLNTCVQQRLEHIIVFLHHHLDEGGREPRGRRCKTPLMNVVACIVMLALRGLRQGIKGSESA